MRVEELKNLWNVGDPVTVYTTNENTSEYEMLIDGDDELEFTELDEAYDNYIVEGIYKNHEYDCIEIHIEK